MDWKNWSGMVEKGEISSDLWLSRKYTLTGSG